MPRRYAVVAGDLKLGSVEAPAIAVNLGGWQFDLDRPVPGWALDTVTLPMVMFEGEPVLVADEVEALLPHIDSFRNLKGDKPCPDSDR